jgi:capsular exopolysaccharide synthesis family protein
MGVALNSHAPVGTRKRRRLDPHLVTFLQPGTFAADRYQLVRHALELKHEGGARIFAVTSPSGGEGKTTTVLNLGGALAKDSATQVLLVEADLRRPCMLERLGLGAGAVGGLLQTLTRSRVPPSEAIIRALGSNLWLAPAGGSTAAPYELLRSPRFSDFLTATRARFDYVLIDTPPLLICPEFQAIERWCDATLLVVAANRTPRKQVSEAVAQLDRAKALGVVLNADANAVDSYYRQSSRSARRSLAR